MKQYILGLFIVIGLTACKSQISMKHKSSTPTVDKNEIIAHSAHPIMNGNAMNISSPVVFIYQTDGDYFDKVPVILSNDRTEIISYPSPGDLKQGDALTLPTRLVDGWLLDNRGIGPTVAFLNYTYDEYSRMPSAPSPDVLMQHIITKNPLKQWRICGRKADYTNLVPQLNELIENKFESVD